MIKYSFILPCYNVEQYIESALDSITNNDMTDCEVIIVDDGSTDHTLRVCKEYFGITEAGSVCKVIKNSVNIIICSKKNGGVSSARNVGIELASGEYILFVDPDDLIKKNYVDALDKVINNEADIDIVYFGFDKVTYTHNRGGDTVTTVLPRTQYNFDTKEEVYSNVFPKFIGYSSDDIKAWGKGENLFLRLEWGACWRAAYRRRMLIENNVRFNENIKLNEDSMFNALAALYANKTRSIDEPLYVYHIRSVGAFKSLLGKSVIENKRQLFSERAHIVRLAVDQGYTADENFYCGSIVLGIMEMLVKAEVNEWKAISEILRDSTVKKAIKVAPYIINIKYTGALVFIKLGLSKFLFSCIQILNKFGIHFSV